VTWQPDYIDGTHFKMKTSSIAISSAIIPVASAGAHGIAFRQIQSGQPQRGHPVRSRIKIDKLLGRFGDTA